MHHTEVKLDRFTSSIIESAANESRDILTRIERERGDSIAAKENDFLGEAYRKIKDDVAHISAECGREISRKVLSSKRAVYQRRSEIERDILLRLRTRIEAYTKTPAYEGSLAQSAERLAARVGDKPCVIYLRPEDMSHAKRLAALFPGGAEVKSAPIELGGLILECQSAHLRIDETLDESFAEAGTLFAEIYQNAAHTKAAPDRGGRADI